MNPDRQVLYEQTILLKPIDYMINWNYPESSNRDDDDDFFPDLSDGRRWQWDPTIDVIQPFEDCLEAGQVEEDQFGDHKGID